MGLFLLARLFVCLFVSSCLGTLTFVIGKKCWSGFNVKWLAIDLTLVYIES